MSSARSLAAAALAGLVLASCGGDDPKPSARDSGAGEAPAAARSTSDAQRAEAPRQAETPSGPSAPSGRDSSPKDAAPEKSPRKGPPEAESEVRKPNAAARRLLGALKGEGDAGRPPPAGDPASRKLWALVQRRLARTGAPAPAQAAPTPGALRRLLRGARRQPGG